MDRVHRGPRSRPVDRPHETTVSRAHQPEPVCKSEWATWPHQRLTRGGPSPAHSGPNPAQPRPNRARSRPGQS